MSKKALLLVFCALAVLISSPAAPGFVGAEPLKADESKLNYYRMPGLAPFCGDTCDGLACCTTPGG